MESGKSETPAAKPLKAANPPAESERYKVHIYVALGVSVALLVGLALYLALAYEEGWFPFQPYAQPALAAPSFYPLGPVSTLTAEQLQQRQQLIDSSSAQG